MSLKRCLIIPDCHRPFHSRKAYNLMLEVASHVGINEVVLLGDYADFYAVSRHLKDPRVTQKLEDEVKSVNEGLDELDRLFPQSKKVYLEGNHENRLERYLVERAPEAFGVTDIQTLFRIYQRTNWRYIGFDRNQVYQVLGSELYARHRPLAVNPLTGLQKGFVSLVFGDIHKILEMQAVGLDKKTRIAFCPGWLGDVRNRVFDYMPSVPQWQLGFALVTVDGSSKSFHHEIVQIKENYTCITQGKRFKA